MYLAAIEENLLNKFAFEWHLKIAQIGHFHLKG